MMMQSQWCDTGRVLCVICFECFDPDELYVDPSGKTWDMCAKDGSDEAEMRELRLEGEQ